MKTNNQHYWLIELLTYWEGEVCTRHLREFFGLSRQQASKHLQSYLTNYPDHLDYDPSLKRYVPGPAFTATHISCDVNEYLNWLTGIRSLMPSGKSLLSLPHFAISPAPRRVSNQVMRLLVKALRQQRRLEVDYLSVSSADPDGRIIVPHAFVNTGLRWHLRAWCEKNRAYRDFVLSRFRGVPDLLDRSEHGPENDEAWNTEVNVILRPDPRLKPTQQSALEQDYGMENSQLTLTCRAALVHYLLQEMQVNIKVLDGSPEAQQLVLVNTEELRPWLFNI
ncbi:WYL domain-containing protein [Granulosicoccaceae sp. 1_MG-2023]|nr:WYL domain-containing protein [Granulosicoccaceae sp. 1_MG-2023]